MNWFSKSFSEDIRNELEPEDARKHWEDQSSSHQAVCQNLINWYNTEKEYPPPWDRGVLFPNDVLGEIKIQVLDPSGEFVREDPVGIHDVFRSLRSSSHRPRKVLIRGEAGIGKTTLCNRMVLEWKKNGGVLPESRFGMVLLVYFRLRSLGSRADLETELFKCLVEASGSGFSKMDTPGTMLKDFKVILLLDGYNEVSAKHQEKVVDLLSSKTSLHFQNVSVIVTTRPDVERDFLVLFDRHFVLSSLSVNAADVLIRKYYHNSDCVVNFMMSKFYDILHKYKMSPLLLVMLCYLQRHNYDGKLETFEQVVYQCAFEISKRTSEYRHLKKEITELRLDELGKYLLKCLHEKKFLFPRAEIEAMLSDSVAFGLFKMTNYIRQSQNTVEVVHPCVMEVLAMHYVNEFWYSPSNAKSLTNFVPNFIQYLSFLEMYAYKDCHDGLCIKVIGKSKGLGIFVWDFKDGSCIFSTCVNKCSVTRKMGVCKLNINFSLKLDSKKLFSQFQVSLENLFPNIPFVTQVSYLVSQFDSIALQMNFVVNEEYQLCKSLSELYRRDESDERSVSVWTNLRDMAGEVNLTFLGKGCSHQDVELVLRYLMDLDLKLEKETTQATELLNALKKCNEKNFICTLAAVARLGHYYLLDTKRRYAFEDLRPWAKKKFFQPKYSWETVDMFVVSWQSKMLSCLSCLQSTYLNAPDK